MMYTSVLVDHCALVPTTRPGGRGGLARRYRASHSNIDLPDYVIGATTLESGAKLWTCNVKHFPMFEDLQPPY